MSIPSNLYAEKVFAEHPTVLWALDDKADYISLINEEKRSVFNWSVTGGSAEEFDSVYDEPFIDSSITKLTGELSTQDFGEIVCISDNLSNFITLNSYMSTFSIGAYVNSISSYIAGIEIGYEYYDPLSGEVIQNLKNYNTSIYGKWMFVAETFEIPDKNTTFRIVLKIKYISGSQFENDYQFLVNGITLGQWSEEFNSTSLGVQKVLVPQDIAISESYGVEARAYGLSDSPGYYMVSDNALVAKNSGIPLVYGSTNTTILKENGDLPSLIIPGNGFLNEGGKFKEQTLEMWVRINSDTSVKKRICGPISSSDGIYVDGPFIILKIDNHYGSHYIGEWVRPMIVHVRLTNNSANLLVNGEQVISLNIITAELNLPDKYNSNGKDQDWIGFYAYEDVSPIELDCIAIYPYQVPSIVAKRRFVYGQGVEVPENINASYSGTSLFIDYPFSNYSNNYSYPDIGRWSQASVDNLVTSSNVLSIPEYNLPTIFFNNKTTEQWYAACKNIQNESSMLFRLRPNADWNSTSGYILFDSLDITNTPIRSFYGVFKVLATPSSPQVLFKVDDQITGNSFVIELQTTLELEYKIIKSSGEKFIYETVPVNIGEEFISGMDINTFCSHYGQDVASFFGNRSSLKLYVGGDTTLSKMFLGNIYKIGFATERNYSFISECFNDFGTPTNFENVFNTYNQYIDYDAGQYVGATSYFWDYILDGGNINSYPTQRLIDHIASYTLTPNNYFDTFALDIDVDGYWEDHIPLSYFAKYVTDAKNESYYDLDFVQFNLNYPAPSKFVEESQVGSWNYDELQSEYQNPIQRTYESLDNHLFTGYINYSDLKNRSSKTYKYDTSSSLVKSYVSFQYISTGANAKDSYFTNIEAPLQNGIVEPGTYFLGYDDNNNPVYDNFINTKYEVVDGMLLYPPKGTDFNDLAVVIHLNFKVRGILNNPVRVKSLQLASQAYNDVAPNPIGSRFGVQIYPYTKTGIYYDYKKTNPYTIYKGSSPYLYLTKNSGIQVKGSYDPLINRGLSIPVNPNKSSNYKVMAMQAAVRYDQDFFPYAPTQIFEVEGKNDLIKFFMVANHPDGKRAKIYAINARTGQIENGIGFYWNGNLVKEPNITIREWGMLGVSFSSIVNFDNYVGSIKINGPLLVNLVSHYKSTNLQEVQNITERPWFKVKYLGPLELEWEYWNSAYVWNGVLILSTKSYYGVDPSDVYKSYIGTNKIIVDDTRKFRLNSYQYELYTDILWQSQTSNPV